MNTNRHWEELARYFAGELNKEKELSMHRWITADPQREEKVRKLHKIWKESAFTSYHLDVEKAWDELARNMDKLDQMPDTYKYLDSPNTGNGLGVEHHQTSRKSVDVMRRTVIAAVAAVVIVATGLVTYFNYSIDEPTDIGIKELIAQNGERITYVLSDSSRITLHSGSRLEVPLNFNEEKRELFLEGEAFFEVAHDATKPFIVHSENAHTRVLGTKFLVQAWPDIGGQVEVVVTEGKVAFGAFQSMGADSTKEVVITHNQKGILNKGGEPVVTEDVDMNWHMGWTRGQLVFDDRSLNEIIPKLERWYSINIELKDKSIGANRLTAEIDYSQPMGEVLEGIALTLDLELEKSGRTFTYNVSSEEKEGI